MNKVIYARRRYAGCAISRDIGNEVLCRIAGCPTHRMQADAIRYPDYPDADTFRHQVVLATTRRAAISSHVVVTNE
jgi:hypothetical protein